MSSGSAPPSTSPPASESSPSSQPPSSTEPPPSSPSSPPPDSNTNTNTNTNTDTNTSGGGGGGSSGNGSSGTPTETTRSTESTVSTPLATVVQTTVVVTSNGQQFTTVVETGTTLAPGTVVTSPANDSSGGGRGGSSNTGAIAGGVVGGIAGLAILLALLIWGYKRYRLRKAIEEFDGNFDPDRVVTTQRPNSGVLTGAGGSGRRRNQETAPTLPQIPVEEDDDGMGGRLNAASVGGGVVSPYPLFAPPSAHHSQTQFPNPPQSPTNASTSDGSHYTGYGGLAPGQDWRHPSPGPSLPNTAPSVGSSSHSGGAVGGMSAARLAKEREAFGMPVPQHHQPQHPNQPNPYNQPVSGSDGRRMSASSNTPSGVFYSTTSEGSQSQPNSQGGHGRLAVVNPDTEFEEAHRTYLAQGPIVHRDAGPARDEIPPTYESLLPRGVAASDVPRPPEKAPQLRQQGTAGQGTGEGGSGSGSGERRD